MTYAHIYRMGYDAATLGCITLADCPFEDGSQERSAWVFGFTEGLRYLYTVDILQTV